MPRLEKVLKAYQRSELAQLFDERRTWAILLPILLPPNGRRVTSVNVIYESRRVSPVGKHPHVAVWRVWADQSPPDVHCGHDTGGRRA